MDYLDSMTEKCSKRVKELFPWELVDMMQQANNILIVDVREPNEYQFGHIQASINVPRGILETASTFGYEDTEPQLAGAKDKSIILACRSGKRSLWAGCTMQSLGFKNVFSLKTGIRGWNDFEQPLVTESNETVPIAKADVFFTPKITPAQLGKSWVVKDWKA